MSDLREGLAKAMYYADVDGLNDYDAWDELGDDVREYGREMADAALAYIRQHDGHAEFVRKVRERVNEIFHCADSASLAEKKAIKLLALCDAELAKEQP